MMSQEKPYMLKCPSCGVELPCVIGLDKSFYQNKQPEPKPLLGVRDVETMLPEELKGKLNINIHGNDTIHITPKAYLGSELFYKLITTVKAHKGEYVSKGKQSYFWIPRQ